MYNLELKSIQIFTDKKSTFINSDKNSLKDVTHIGFRYH